MFKQLTSEIIQPLKVSLANMLGTRLARLERKVDALEQFSHGSRATYIGNNRVLVKIVVDRRNIAYIVEASDKLISPWFIVTGTYEAALTAYFVREMKSDSHCIDVGANFGYFTCLMARLAPDGVVIGVEADPKIFELLNDNIAINGFERFAHPLNAAAASAEGELTFYRRSIRSGNTSIVNYGSEFAQVMREPPSEPFTIKAVPIDHMTATMEGRVDFMKVDVEGSEPLVFQGARETIANNPSLRIVMEWSPGQIQCAGFDVRGFLGDLEAQGLEAFDMEAGKLSAITYDELMNLPYRAGVVLTRRTSR